MSSSKSASRQPSVSKNNRHTSFNRFVRTLSDSPEDVDLEVMVKNQENQPRIKTNINNHIQDLNTVIVVQKELYHKF
jgi:hypothetical protein